MADVLHDVIIVDAALLVKPEEKAPITANQDDLLQEQLKEAYQNGYARGKQEGLDEGQALEKNRMSSEMHQCRQDLQSLIEQIPEHIAKLRNDLRQDLSPIVLGIVSQLFIQRQLDKTWVFEQVNQILNQINQNQEVELFLHPKDIQYLQTHQIPLDSQHLSHLKICPDPHLSLGGCRIKTNHGVFDASVAKQIHQLQNILLTIQQGDEHV